jgi:hypothetical protein
MNDQPWLWPTVQLSLLEGTDNQTVIDPMVHGPAYDTTRTRVKENRKIQPAFLCAYVSNV